MRAIRVSASGAASRRIAARYQAAVSLRGVTSVPDGRAWQEGSGAAGLGTSGSGDVLLNAIAAAVIGGTSLFGGRGRVVGTLLGALIVGVFSNGLTLAGVDVLWQTFTTGVLVVVAVGLDQWTRKVAG